MQKKHIRKFIPLLVILLLVGCWMLSTFVIHAPPKKTVVAEFETYSILKAKDQYYLRIHVSEDTKPKTLSAVPILSIYRTPAPEFRSIQEMRHCILNGKLTQENLHYIWQHFPYDHDLDFYILDPYNIPVPQIPSHMYVNWVIWHESSCDFILRGSSGLWISMECCKQTEDHNVHAKFDSNLKRLKESIYKTEKIQDRNATVYYHYSTINQERKIKTVLYDLSTEGKQLVIYEHYDNPNDTVPAFTDFCGIENGVYFEGRIEDADSRLSVEFLQSLGISPEPAR